MWSNSQSLPRSPEHRDVSSSKRQMKVSVRTSYFLSESDLNANADRPSSVLPHSWSSAVRMDTNMPLHQHPEVVVCSNSTVLKLRHVPVKPAEKQKFTDGQLPKRRGMRSLKHMTEDSLKDISYLSCEPDLNASTDHSSSLLPHSERREVRMDKRTPLHPHSDAPRSKLPVPMPKRVPVKPVNKQSFTDEPSEWLGVGLNHMMKGSQSVRMDKRRPHRQHHDAPHSKPAILKPNHVPVKPVNKQCFTDEPSEWLGVGSCEHQMKVSLKDPPCESDLNVSAKCSSSLLAARVSKSQHQAGRFSPLERNGTDPSCGSDWKVKSHLSLPCLPRLTSRVKMDKHVPLHVPVFTKLLAPKPANVPVQPALDEDVKMKRARSAKRDPLQLSRFHSATYF
ncbi:uncharacterized protein [Danio rerio]|uniref:Uncharacterized protein n=1 Tax=Danio rerio TaxID=7955 RepID=A0AB32T7W3_DANRE